MAKIEKSVEVKAPLSVVYAQWQRFDTFPDFMAGIQEVRSLGGGRVYWRARVGTEVMEWEAEITENIPDQRIAWRSVRGRPNSGAVAFHAVSADRTRVVVTLDYEPEDTVERLGAAVGLPNHRVEEDLKRFKAYIERLGEKAHAATHGRRDSRDASPPVAGGAAEVETTGQTASPPTGEPHSRKP